MKEDAKMVITDGKRTVEIRMMIWEGTNWSPDMSLDFFQAGGLKRDETDAYIVPDVAYCIDYAKDWENRSGDFCEYPDDADSTSEERGVFVEEV